MKWFGTFICILFTLPNITYAAVVINEIAWMGTHNSANDEWIELYNDGTTSADLAGWTLRDNVGLEIVLEGVMSPGAFAVLERSDDDSAPGAAFLVYTGALANDGRTLTLRNSSEAIQDQVAGGEGWQELGGDNDTKETAQRTEGGWITAVPTPGAQNKTVETSSSEPDDTSSESEGATKEQNSTKNTEHISMTLPNTVLSLGVIAPKTATVNQPVSFEVVPHGIGEHLMHSLVYGWSFGDLSVAHGKSVTHTFAYPGTYIVVVEGEYARHRALARHEVTVLPVTFRIERASNGDILLHNTAKYEVDISGYRLVGDYELHAPSHTILPANGTLRVPRKKIEHGTEKMIELYDRTSAVVASYIPGHGTPTPSSQEFAIEVDTVSTQKVETAVIQKSGAPDARVIEEVVYTDEPILSSGDALNAQTTTTTLIPISTPGTASVIDSRFTLQNERLPYLGLVGIILLALYLLSSQKKPKYTDS